MPSVFYTRSDVLFFWKQVSYTFNLKYVQSWYIIRHLLLYQYVYMTLTPSYGVDRNCSVSGAIVSGAISASIWSRVGPTPTSRARGGIERSIISGQQPRGAGVVARCEWLCTSTKYIESDRGTRVGRPTDIVRPPHQPSRFRRAGSGD
eukprot:SAG31_NODE_8833_length_1378_cov_5.069586_1_plen_148_part_00